MRSRLLEIDPKLVKIKVCVARSLSKYKFKRGYISASIRLSKVLIFSPVDFTEEQGLLVNSQKFT